MRAGPGEYKVGIVNSLNLKNEKTIDKLSAIKAHGVMLHSLRLWVEVQMKIESKCQ